ncbi:hypothetical protein BAUCODRAFT_33580 [Baudoinia panamericana UAMH 10762]|uniref:Uncharacterized protein n=1 Tax=Baudoinia panamericana (strain UAMH 10762) TaxID=717646 RepID=M2MHW6_BAUPA|nr:uncharacterized protein BAUCODRAFT_33580 [Baudoinia panamericana UAMH 10762]EMC96231.1 hypothetical protein BAUCODRAFT_33580 [Baudoinia panamericana UAMH 10762]
MHGGKYYVSPSPRVDRVQDVPLPTHRVDAAVTSDSNLPINTAVRRIPLAAFSSFSRPQARPGY